jgi:hypothetical protein
LNNPVDPSGGTQYVYAYQVLALQEGNIPIDQLSVGFLDLPPEGDGIDDLEDPQNIGFLDGFASAGVPDPVAAFNQPNAVIEAATWAFPGGLDPAQPEQGDILLYTSPYGPEWDAGSLLAGALSDTHRLPSPTPEPATLGLALVAAASLAAWRRTRRRSRS